MAEGAPTDAAQEPHVLQGQAVPSSRSKRKADGAQPERLESFDSGGVKRGKQSVALHTEARSLESQYAAAAAAALTPPDSACSGSRGEAGTLTAESYREKVHRLFLKTGLHPNEEIYVRWHILQEELADEASTAAPSDDASKVALGPAAAVSNSADKVSDGSCGDGTGDRFVTTQTEVVWWKAKIVDEYPHPLRTSKAIALAAQLKKKKAERCATSSPEDAGTSRNSSGQTSSQEAISFKSPVVPRLPAPLADPSGITAKEAGVEAGPNGSDHSATDPSTTADSENATCDIWTLQYEKLRNFAAETCRVEFLDTKRLRHLDGYQQTNFSLYSTEAQEDAVVETDEDGTDGEETEEVTLGEILEAQRALDIEDGDEEASSAEALMMKAFDTLSHEKKITYALGYRLLCEKLNKYLSGIVSEKGPSHTVNVSDIQKFFSQIGAELLEADLS